MAKKKRGKEASAKKKSGGGTAATDPSISGDDDPNADTPWEGGSRPADQEYLDAPPGQQTYVAMQTAGVFSRRKKHKSAAVIGTVVGATLLLVITLDVTGVWEIPGLGLVYDVTGFADPNPERAVRRVEEKLESSALSEAERKALRDKLLGLKKTAPTPAPSTVGIEEKNDMAADDRALAKSLFADTRKTEQKLELTPPKEIQAPNLPDGLTADAIFKVVSENSRAMSLCIAQSMKEGEKLTGKMEVELTILASGSVGDGQITTATFQRTTIGRCAVKTVRRWKFPRFNGDPVVVSFPYVLSAGL